MFPGYHHTPSGRALSPSNPVGPGITGDRPSTEHRPSPAAGPSMPSSLPKLRPWPQWGGPAAGNPGERESCRRRWGLPSHCPSKTSTGHSKPKGSGSPRSDLPPIRCSLGHRQTPAIANVAGASSSLYIGSLHPLSQNEAAGIRYRNKHYGICLVSWHQWTQSVILAISTAVPEGRGEPASGTGTCPAHGGRTLAFPRPLGDRRTVHTRPRSHSLRTCELNLAAGKPDPRLHEPPAAGHQSGAGGRLGLNSADARRPRHTKSQRRSAPRTRRAKLGATAVRQLMGTES